MLEQLLVSLSNIIVKPGWVYISCLWALGLAVEIRRALFNECDEKSFWGILPLFLHFDNQSCSPTIIFLSRRFILLRGLCLCYFFAFRSLSLQVTGILNNDCGLLPLDTSLTNVRRLLSNRNKMVRISSNGPESNRPDLPKSTLDAWILKLVVLMMSPSEYIPEYPKVLSHVSATLSLIGVLFPNPFLLMFLYCSYVSFKKVCGPFLNFAWDALLLESGIYAIILSLSIDRGVSAIVLWSFRVLLFRLIYGSGVMKLTSKDKAWNKSLNAVSYHFLTQPLPKSLATLMAQLPSEVLQFVTASVVLVECIGPVLSFLPVFEIFSFAVFVMLQCLIVAAGNFGFFNILTITLCVCLLPETAFVLLSRLASHYRILLSRYALSLLTDFEISKFYNQVEEVFRQVLFILYPVESNIPVQSDLNYNVSAFSFAYNIDFFVLVCTILITAVNLQALIFLYDRVNPRIIEDPSSNWMQDMIKSIHSYSSALYIGGHYGLFGTITKAREEVAIFVSKDGASEWLSVEFAFKPGLPIQAPKGTYPLFHMPRLDWLMWFVALRPQPADWPDWFWRLIYGILEGKPEIQQLLHPTLNKAVFEANASSSDVQYHYIRVQLFEYRFSKRKAESNPTVPFTASAIGSTLGGLTTPRIDDTLLTSSHSPKSKYSNEPYNKDIDSSSQNPLPASSTSPGYATSPISSPRDNEPNQRSLVQPQKLVKFWSLKFRGNLLPPMPLSHVVTYHNKIRKSKKLTTVDELHNTQSNIARASEIIQRFAYYTTNPLHERTKTQISVLTSSYSNKPIRSSIQRSPQVSPRVGSDIGSPSKTSLVEPVKRNLSALSNFSPDKHDSLSDRISLQEEN